MRSFTILSAVFFAASALALPARPSQNAPAAQEAPSPDSDGTLGGLSTLIPDADAALDLGGLGGDLSRRQDNTVGDCNVTGQYCCDSLVSHSSASASALTGLLSLPTSLLPDQDSYMGLGCSPIASLLESGGQCSTNQVCCKGSQKMENGLINVGCSSVSA